MKNEKTPTTSAEHAAVHRASDDLLTEAMELLRFQVDPRHSKRPAKSDVRKWMERSRAHIATMRQVAASTCYKCGKPTMYNEEAKLWVGSCDDHCSHKANQFQSAMECERCVPVAD